MNHIIRWCAKHRTAAKIILIGILCSSYIWLLSIVNAAPGIIFAVVIVLAFFIGTAVESCAQYLVKEPLRILDEQCDPYPFLEETQKLLTYKNSKVTRQALLINYAVALRDTGDYHQTLAVLNGIHIDQFSGTIPPVKIVYYHNLADILTVLNRYDEAEIWYKMALEIFEDMPDNKFKRELSNAMESAKADHCFRIGDYRGAIELVGKATAQNLRKQISHALLLARCHVALDESQAAREELAFVIQHGNKLHDVKEAQMLMDTLE